MGLGSLGNHRNDDGSAQLRTFFNGPLHAIELEDRDQESQAWSGGGGNDFAQVKFDPALGDIRNMPAADIFTRANIEFLPNATAQHACEMVGVRTNQRGAIAGNFVGEPAAASHGGKDVILNGVRPLVCAAGTAAAKVASFGRSDGTACPSPVVLREVTRR